MEKLKWPVHLMLVNRWLKDNTDYSVYTVLPDNFSELVPAIQTSLSPSGELSGVERSVSVDIDLFAKGWGKMTEMIQNVESAVASLGGNGNMYGYADDVSLTAFADVPWGDGGILRTTANLSLTTRPLG